MNSPWEKTKNHTRWRNQFLLHTDQRDYLISYIEDQDETAIITEDHKYRILNGDWRKEYEEIYQNGLEACIEFFNNNENSKSKWSD